MYIFSKNINEKKINQQIKMIGWIQKIRKMGSIIFIDLRDGYGITQLVFKESSDIFKIIISLTKETLISVEGKLIIRSKINTKIFTGSFEVLVSKIDIINKSELPPFLIKNDTDGLEKIRLEYRFLDLRRKILKNNLLFRSKVLQNIREFLNKKEFIEIETPILSFPTIEGADSFIVLSNNKKNYSFALPQSPQIYKQTLMNAGFPNYYQIAKCFRDENLRNDRQPEFTQLDLEVCFSKKDEIMQIIENLIKYIWKKNNFKIIGEFQKIKFEDSISKYGTDKPDLRFGLEIRDLIFLKIKENEIARGIWFKNQLTKEHFNILKNEIRKITEKSFIINSKTISMNLDLEEIELVKKYSKGKNLIAFISNKSEVNVVLCQIRKLLGLFFNLIDGNIYKFCWIIEPPMFEYSDIKNKYISAHHPFTLPKNLDEFDKNWKKSKSLGYDLVVNGIELGSGSERIYDEKLQKKVFKILGMNELQIEKEFGFFLKSMRFGYPPHAGIALGIDRIIMVILNVKSIRDVIAFPKTLNFNCLFSKSPRKMKK